jgi:hypothetical protein
MSPSGRIGFALAGGAMPSLQPPPLNHNRLKCDADDAPGLQAISTRLSREQLGHLIKDLSSSSNQDRPHSQRILYSRWAVAVLNSSS